MTSLAAHLRHSRADDHRPLRASSLLCLIALICHSGDRRALEEFHGYRPVFRFRGGPPSLLVKLLDSLRREYATRRLSGDDPSVADRGYDITIDKFTNLPGAPRQGAPVKQSGSDCRLYFGTVLRHGEAWRRSHPSADDLQEETAIARYLQRLVVRHFYLSCLDAKRSLDRTRTRYAWSVGGGVVYVWLPSRLPGNQRRAWLEANIDDPDPARPGETKRVQSIVNLRFGWASTLPLGSKVNRLPTDRAEDAPLRWLLEREVSIRGLAETVADEKANNLARQRDAIRAIGCHNLRRLILRVFEDLSRGCYRDSAVASAFDISKATFSRFAGSRWQTNSKSVVPDLWANTARVLAHHSEFVEMAREAGVWPKIEVIVRADNRRCSP
ncbi:MAG: hypothetical protein J5J06_15735 [Phycisphaerae bacterium]|nr:hypothetical protein [Phycisphaerae bacterium]